MAGNPKNVFLQAFFLTAVIFVFGLLLGVAFEASRIDKVNEYYARSEISLIDAVALNSLTDLSDSSCEYLVDANIDFANRIYEEAKLLDRYEDAGKIDDNIKLAHKRYDLLRTFLWINVIKTREKCSEEFSSVVYLYEYESKDLAKRATQNVWSKVLFDLKQEMGNDIILLSIAANNNIDSLDSLKRKFGISRLPAVIINEKYVIQELSSVESLKRYLV